jgi:lysophospholipase L1-like esterase
MRRLTFRLALIVAAPLLFGWSSLTAAQTPAPDHKTIARVPANPALPSLYIVGDSTADQSVDRLHEGFSGVQGWGVLFPAFFEASRLNVVDVARGGRSSRTFITEGFWGAALTSIKAGDIVLIQLGQNDVFAINDETRARGTIPGTGPETEEIDNLVTHKHEIVHTYGWYLRTIVQETRAKGATPIVMSLTPANTWKDGHIEVGVSHYREWSRTVAAEEKAAFVDISAIIAGQFEKFGQAKTFGLYHTKEPIHMNLAGSFVAAACVLAGLKDVPDLHLDNYLTALGSLTPDAAFLALPTLPQQPKQ